MLWVLKHKRFGLVEHKELNARQKVEVQFGGCLIGFLPCEHPDGQGRCYDNVTFIETLIKF